jgi:hypothetical protein
MSASPLAMPAQPHDFDDPDLLQLLGAKGFAHWHGPLLLLMSRYAGWLADYEFDPAFDPDLRPLSEVITATAGLAGRDRYHADTRAVDQANDHALAYALLSQCDFLARDALDRASRTHWDPLAQSYRDFLIQYPQAEPLWGTGAPWTVVDLVAWALAQRAPPGAGTAGGASAGGAGGDPQG